MGMYQNYGGAGSQYRGTGRITQFGPVFGILDNFVLHSYDFLLHLHGADKDKTTRLLPPFATILPSPCVVPYIHGRNAPITNSNF